MIANCPVRGSAPDRRSAPQRNVRSSLAKGNPSSRKGKGGKSKSFKGKGKGKAAVRNMDVDDDEEYYDNTEVVEIYNDEGASPLFDDPPDMA